MTPVNAATDRQACRKPWHRRARHALGHSIKLRLVLVFLLLALAMALTFIGGAQKAFSISWREAARPLLMDYVDHLASDITAGGKEPPSIERAQAITERLPITITIAGPQVNWASHPAQARPDWQRNKPGTENDARPEHWGSDKDWQRLLQRTTLDGHSIKFGINDAAFERRPRLIGYTLTALLLLTLLAFLYVRRLLRPLDDIRAGALRFGTGEFGQPIAVRHAHKPDELGQLATTINTMGSDIRDMLDAKRALLLAISHELRSPLTRARLNTELLPESADIAPQRDALLRDLREMAGLITDLLESERLASRHAALQREATDLAALVDEVVSSLPGAPDVQQHIAPDLPTLALDRARMRLLLRNLLDNALRHSDGASQPPTINVQVDQPGKRQDKEPGHGLGVRITVRDHGPGVPEDQLPHLAQPFYRPDAARSRAEGGVGLGLYLCKLVAQAHGGRFSVRNAQPGLEVCVTLPGTDV